MISSMTGYGKSIAEAADRKIMVEVRSLNSRYMDLNLRLPYFFKEKEIELRNLITTEVERGKVDYIVSIDNGSAQAAQEIVESGTAARR